MKIFKSDYPKLVDLIYAAQNQITVVLPNISIEFAEALARTRERNCNTIAFLDVREEVYREGYGDIEAIKILKDGGVKVMNIQKSNITFLLIDNTGYFYFPKSRFYEEEGSSYDLVLMSSDQAKILRSLFSDPDVPLSEDQNNEMLDSKLYMLKEEIKPLDDESVRVIEEKLEINPPLKPLLKRMLNTYIARFKFVELKFPGSNLHRTKIPLPKKALPFRDADLTKAINANLKLFTDIPSLDFFKPFFDLKSEVDSLRIQFHVHLKCRDKSLIRIEEMNDFMSQLEELRKRLGVVEKKIIDDIQSEINKVENRIKQNLIDFYLNNPPEHLLVYSGDVLHKGIIRHVQNIVYNINLPDAKSLLDKLKLDCHFYDITWDDLNNNEVLQEMIFHGLINDKDAAKIMTLAVEVQKQ